MKKIESKLWNIYICTSEEMNVIVREKHHLKSEEGKKLTSLYTDTEYYFDGEYFGEDIKEAITRFILGNEFININENMTEEECDKRATEVSYSLINEVLKNL